MPYLFWWTGEENAVTLGVGAGTFDWAGFFVVYSEFPADVLKNYARFLRSLNSQKNLMRVKKF